MKLAREEVSVLEPKVPLPVPEGHLLAGKYRIEKVIGAGGMGVVVAAIHVHLGQRVAIKFLLPHAATEEQTLIRFAREARALARIESEHVGRVIDVGVLDTGEPYMVLECLSGRNLAELVARRGALEIGEAVSYVVQACQAMVEAHALGIIHRDLKPENLFLAERADGSRIIKVIDFGISKLSTDETAFEAKPVTTSSAMVGSPLYMSPEQLRSARDVDVRTDIWSLGVTLYELLTTEGPFRWSTLPELCAAILKDTPRPLRQLRPEVPAALEAVVMRCLEREPALRPASAAELARDLRPFAAPVTTPALDHVSPAAMSVRVPLLPELGCSPLASKSIAPEATVPLSSAAMITAPCFGVRLVRPSSAPPPPSDHRIPEAMCMETMGMSHPTPSTGMTTVARIPKRQHRRVGPVVMGIALLGTLGVGVVLRLGVSWSKVPARTAAASLPVLASVAVATSEAAEVAGPPPPPTTAASAAPPQPIAATKSTAAALSPPARRPAESDLASTPPSVRTANARPVRRSNQGSAFEHRK
jgi:serine/threonine-protein kinase